MQRRYFPSILLYGLGLALALSLVYNGVLLYEQNHLRNAYEYGLTNSIHPLDRVDWQQQLLECKRANQQKDSLIRQLEQAPNAPPNKVTTFRHALSK
ncbi:hypothetical protein [Spirosoma panaciterrae]|uniref:hypothetical protein n=1 Tax=Spirosoma panaciterrae TaxID=496058 RepID=UPI000364247E|nr:hypothetical protein [Spirosoma panaciterrae]